MKEIWGQTRADLCATVGKDQFAAWIEPLVLTRLDAAGACFAAPTRFMSDWVSRHYSDMILEGLARAGHAVPRLQIDVVQQAPAAPVAVPARPSALAGQGGDAAGARNTDGLGAPIDTRFSFGNFVVGKPNALAHAAALRVAEGGPVTFNPLFLYGGVGLGKTHLMHAIAREIQLRRPDETVLYLSAEQFMYRFVQALRERTVMDFKEMFRAVGVLMVDDVQFIAGKESTQEEFFHTFNALVDQGKQIVISADRAPGEIKDLEERIKSRLSSGLVVDLHPTDYELRLGILQTKSDAFRGQYSNIDIAPQVLEFLARRITSNVRVLEGALQRLLAHASLLGREIDLNMAEQSLADILRASDRRVTVEEIQRRVAEHYNIRLSDLVGPRRLRVVARPRQVAMFLSKEMTARSLPEIGRRFGGRDHTTIMHGVRKIEELAASDDQLAEDLDMLRRLLQG